MTQALIHPKDINLAQAEVFERAEAHELLRVLRNHEPVHWNPGGPRNNDFWNITKYEDVLFISRHPELFISSKGIAGSGLRPEVMEELMKDPTTAMAASGSGNVSIITMDPPRHVKMRRLVNKGFTPRAVNAMEPEIRRITTEILDTIAARGECDFVVDVAAQLPLAVICGMMGLEREHWPLMFELTNSVLGSGDPEYQAEVPEDQRGSPEAAMRTAQAGRMKMIGFFHEVLEDRRRNPRENDLPTILLESEVDGEKLTEGDILAFCFLLILAGNETTRNAISGGLLALDEHPAEKRRLLQDRSLMESAIEEILRWTSPLHHMSRVATADVQIRDKTIKTGERVFMWYPSANRDEEVFEDPYRFDITRTPNDHIAFGIGEHFCLGAGFARKELIVMFDELFNRLPDIEVAGPPERLRSNFINGIKHLPATFTPR
ncbi:MAG TPA: cytochrome P450 [Tepidiformaceae bacterium]|nr:cytochrome P450 [Tepidiformaceae bacterium]